jgi:hypothetical protein
MSTLLKPTKDAKEIAEHVVGGVRVSMTGPTTSGDDKDASWTDRHPRDSHQ